MKYKVLVRRRRGQCLSPQTAPALIAIIKYYLFWGYRILGSHSGGGEIPVSVQVFLKIFIKSIYFFLDNPEGVFNDETSNSVLSNSIDMTGTVLIEVVGLENAECCPFPCDENRTCGLSGCYPTGKLSEAFDELKKVLTSHS
jgi:hypothetical protein